MFYRIINKIVRNNKLKYRRTVDCFSLENGKVFDNDKIGKLSVVLMIGGKYSFIIEIDGNKKYLDGLSDFLASFLFSILAENLNKYSFPDTLKQMYYDYEKIQEIIEELRNNENSTN